MYGLRGTWQATDKFKLSFDGYRSAASRPEGGADTFVTAGLVSATPYAQDIITATDIPHSLPSLNVMIPPSQLGLSACPSGTVSKTNAGYCSYNALMNSGFLNNNNYWSTHYDGLNGYSVHDQITGFTLDGDCGLLILVSARVASLAGSLSPAISASRIVRPLLPTMSATTELSLMLASSSVFCSRWIWLAFSRTSCLRVRSSARISCVSDSGT